MGNANSGRLISIELVQRVERLLQYLPQSQVADEAGVDLGTVQKVQRGEHPHQLALRTSRRCPGCGGKILTDGCLKCTVDRNPAGLRWEDLVDEAIADRAFVEQLGILPPEDSPDKPGARAA